MELVPRDEHGGRNLAQPMRTWSVVVTQRRTLPVLHVLVRLSGRSVLSVLSVLVRAGRVLVRAGPGLLAKGKYRVYMFERHKV